jgi:hypothetical protein
MGTAILEFKKHTTELHTAVVAAPIEHAPVDDTTSA